MRTGIEGAMILWLKHWGVGWSVVLLVMAAGCGDSGTGGGDNTNNTNNTNNSTCSNGVKDGTETDVDCGGSDCDPCDNGKACVGASDCVSGSCVNGVCVEQGQNLSISFVAPTDDDGAQVDRTWTEVAAEVTAQEAASA
ncbi:MAG: hypothetical protein J7M25_01960, partial [Deltaproteobacteria bacterium]|nr:hypothetical protein [Deltaproteobacteria bacterium]